MTRQVVDQAVVVIVAVVAVVAVVVAVVDSMRETEVGRTDVTYWAI